MKKSDLRTGHVVIMRNGHKSMVFLNSIAGVTGGMDILTRDDGTWTYLCNYDENLRHTGDYRYDIVSVHVVRSPIDFSKAIQDVIIERDVWAREEKKKMTVAEIEKILGYGVEIVSER